MTQVVGTSYTVSIPALSDVASITDAFKYYHQGGTSGSPTANSVEQYLINVNSRAAALESAIGSPYSDAQGRTLTTRVATLESTLGSTLGSGLNNTYIKSVPDSNSSLDGRNYITPKAGQINVIPLQIVGLAGQEGSLQEWRTSAATVAKVDKIGRLYSWDVQNSVMADVVTISDKQSLTNKTLLNPIQTIGTLAKNSGFTLAEDSQSKMVEVTSSGGVTVTIPNESLTTIFPTGTYIVIVQMGAGQVTIAGSGFTPIATPGLKLRTQYSMATLIKRGTNSWLVAGDLIA